jgi:cytoskeletal protein RodZ
MKKQVLGENREQAERLADLGMRLRDLRQQQEISLEEVASKTRIRPRLLRAIEQGKIEQLPEPIYVHGFLRQYADAIGLNGVQFASEFPTTSHTAQTTLRPSWRSLPGAQLRPMHLYLFYMLVIVGAVQGLSYVLNRSAQAPIATLELQQPATPMGPRSPVKAPNRSKGTSNKTTVATGQKPVRVGVKLTSESWMQVLVDGKNDFEGVLPQGTQRLWSGDKQVVLRAGNAGGVVVTFNDGQAKALGQPGAIEEVAFPPDPRLANLSTAPLVSP